MGARAFHGNYRFCSYDFSVSSSSELLARHIDELLGQFRSGLGLRGRSYEIDDAEDGTHSVSLDGRQLQNGVGVPGAVDFVLWSITREAIARASGYLLIHAAAASLDGCGVVLPAPPDHGKSTLVAALVRSEFSYLSDEAALIAEGDGVLHPLPRPVWLDRSSIEVVDGLRADVPARYEQMTGRFFHLPADVLRPGSIGGPCRVGLVVTPQYVPGAGTELKPISKAEALVALVGNCFNIHYYGGRALTLLRNVVAGADCYALRTDSLSEAVDAIGSAALAAPVPAAV